MKELLLLLSKYPFDIKDKFALERAMSGISDWKPVVELINLHGIIALAAYNIKEAGLNGLVSHEALTILNNGQQQTLIRNTWLTQKWKEVNRILTEAGIKHVLLKGMALEYTVYGGCGLRQMTDTDMLVKKEDAYAAWVILKEKGFKSPLIKSTLHKGILAEIGNHLPELARDNYIVEVHHTLLKDRKNYFCESEAIDNSKEIFIDGVKAYMLQDEIHLTFLKEHLMKHLELGQYQLRLSNDIRLLSHEDFPEITKDLICNPGKYLNKGYKKIRYKSILAPLSVKNRLKYILGDTVPSMAWMKERYQCNSFTAIFLYPVRFGKLWWLVS